MAKQIKAQNKETQQVQHLEAEHIISPELSEAISSLRPEQRCAVMRAIKQESFSGPIPHPELLQKYENIQSGFAERIVGMAERQLNHRIKCENEIVEGSVDESRRGQNYGFVVALLFLGAAVFLGYSGHDWLAGGLGGGTLVSLVTIFVANKPKKSTDNDAAE